jgi:hypothetical protein
MATSMKTSVAITKFEAKGGGLHLGFRVIDKDTLEVQNLGKAEVSTTIAVVFEFDAGVGSLMRPQGRHNLTLKPREKAIVPLGEQTSGFRIIKVDDAEIIKLAVC